jgi:hypothetical protein
MTILVVIIILSFANLVCFGQPTNLTDRELLIQLTSKIEFIEKSVMRIENYTEDVKLNLGVVEKQVAKNEINIASFFSKLEDLNTRWSALLVLFAGFVITIFVWMWRRAYNGNRKVKVEHR